jgi:hypothetical protein
VDPGFAHGHDRWETGPQQLLKVYVRLWRVDLNPGSRAVHGDGAMIITPVMTTPVLTNPVMILPGQKLMIKRCESNSIGVFMAVYGPRTDIYRRYTCQVI